MKIKLHCIFVILLIAFVSASEAAEHKLKSLIDIRIFQVNGTADSESYLNGNYGKFSFDEGEGVNLAQLGLQYHLDWENGFSATVIANGYSGSAGDTAFGITEAFINFKSLPNIKGWRYKIKAGLFYPKISMENIATAWSSPYTLTSSALNNWLGEELRHSGVELTLDKLGKFSNSKHDFSADISFFQNNDTLGAMLAWHGWTIGNRQTLLSENLIVQPFKARKDLLSEQAANSDPFLELDNRWGTHIVGHWRYNNIWKANFGYYNNNADPKIVKEGQYTWSTEFVHLGIKYKLNKQMEIIGQYMQGSTYMQSPYGDKVVDNDFQSAFIMLRKFWQNHHVALRVEEFSVNDFDQTLGDNNNEYGKGVTVSYRFKLATGSYIQAEYNWINSTRPSRYYVWQPVRLIEEQAQIAYRYYF